MRIGVIPTALDTLCGEHFPHFIHMQENINALRKKVEISVLTANKANAHYMRFRESMAYEVLNFDCLIFCFKQKHRPLLPDYLYLAQ